MIQSFVNSFEKNKDKIRSFFEAGHPDEYKDIVRNVIKFMEIDYMMDEGLINNPDPNRIHEIDDGDYQGTLCFVISEKGYKPNNYYTVLVGYGSCSGCDTLKAIRMDDIGNKPTKEQIDDYMTLSLHIVQRLKSAGGDPA